MGTGYFRRSVGNGAEASGTGSRETKVIISETQSEREKQFGGEEKQPPQVGSLQSEAENENEDRADGQQKAAVTAAEQGIDQLSASQETTTKNSSEKNMTRRGEVIGEAKAWKVKPVCLTVKYLLGLKTSPVEQDWLYFDLLSLVPNCSIRLVIS